MQKEGGSQTTCHWCLNFHLQTPAHTAAIAPTTTTSAVAPQTVSTTTTTTTVIGPPPHRHQTATVLNRQPQNPNGHNQIPATVVSASPATTIVTVVPSAKVCLFILVLSLSVLCIYFFHIKLLTHLYIYRICCFLSFFQIHCICNFYLIFIFTLGLMFLSYDFSLFSQVTLALNPYMPFTCFL